MHRKGAAAKSADAPLADHERPAGRLVMAVIDAVTEQHAQEHERRGELFAPPPPPARGPAAKRAEQSTLAELVARCAAAFEASGAIVLRDVRFGKRTLPLLAVDACCGALVLVDATTKSLASDPQMHDLVARVGRLHDCLADLANGTGLRWRKREWNRLPWDVALMLLRPPRRGDGRLDEGGAPDWTWWPTDWPHALAPQSPSRAGRKKARSQR